MLIRQTTPWELSSVKMLDLLLLVGLGGPGAGRQVALGDLSPQTDPSSPSSH